MGWALIYVLVWMLHLHFTSSLYTHIVARFTSGSGGKLTCSTSGYLSVNHQRQTKLPCNATAHVAEAAHICLRTFQAATRRGIKRPD